MTILKSHLVNRIGLALFIVLAIGSWSRADAAPAAAPDPQSAAPVAPTTEPTTAPAAATTREAPTTQTGRFDDADVRRGPAETAKGSGGGPGATSVGSDIPRLLAALATVIGLIFLLRWVVRRFFALPGTPRGSSVVQVLSRSMVSPRQHLVLFRVGQRVIVASDNGSQISPLSEIVDPDEVASLLGQLRSERDSGVFGASSTRAFHSLFGRLRRSHGGEEMEDGSAASGYDAEDGMNDSSDEHGDGAHDRDPQSRLGDENGGAEKLVASTRSELNGLLEKVRLVSNQFGKS